MESQDSTVTLPATEEVASPEENDRLIAETEAYLASLKAKAAPVPPPTSEPVPPPATVVEALPPGRAVDCDPVAAKPGEIVQLIMSGLSAGTVLRGLVLAAGLRVTTVIVGRQTFPAPGGRWEDCYGSVVPAQSFLILLVENTTKEHKIAKATWYVTGDGAVAAPQAAAPSNAAYVAPVVHAAPTAAVAVADGHGGSHGLGQGLNLSPSHFVSAGGPQTVTPGTNEVAILIQRSECERLLQSVTGGQAITDHERSSIVRQIEAALKR